MKIAVIGTGISGMTCAHFLAEAHDVTVFEAGSYAGGHTATKDVEVDGTTHRIDTGFIVFNEKTYPNFVRLLKRLGVAWQESDMSFSVADEDSGLEYNATNLDGLFAQRRNLLRPSFWRLCREMLRFLDAARELAQGPPTEITLSEFLRRESFSEAFERLHIFPMVSAIWSGRPEDILGFPARYMARFFENHGFLEVHDRPQWLVIEGGSRNYVAPLCKPFAEQLHLETPVQGVRRGSSGVDLRFRDGSTRRFDSVVFATHADTTLRILEDPGADESEVLGRFAYQPNEVLLHTDPAVMPETRRAWASWNYRVGGPSTDRATVTYWMNRLQGLRTPTQFFVSLNQGSSIDESRVLGRFTYDHPIYTPAAVEAQGAYERVGGRKGTHFCGAYWGNGFHEDGVNSALRVLESFGMDPGELLR